MASPESGRGHQRRQKQRSRHSTRPSTSQAPIEIQRRFNAPHTASMSDCIGFGMDNLAMPDLGAYDGSFDFSFDMDNMVMPTLETNDEPFDFNILDHPAFIGEQFPFDELAASPEAGKELRESTHNLQSTPQPMSSHARLPTASRHQCVECDHVYQTQEALSEHAAQSGHKSFVCICGCGFVRKDALTRHIESLDTGIPKYPCNFCRKHRGENGFRRRDHLRQHVRGYHKFDVEKKVPRRRYNGIPTERDCPHVECIEHMPSAAHFINGFPMPFKLRSAFIKHMKEVHDETPHPCEILGCDRVGAKGFATETGFLKHRQAKHPGAPDFVPVSRAGRMLKCPFPGCKSPPLEIDSAAHHAYHTHYTSEERDAYFRGGRDREDVIKRLRARFGV
ncbi:hypothetical protein G7046_g7921 [Stylonectria norvegica]|nr:hypothetical protein G7046_g7921 [Stylonectria norvegica]